MDKKDIVIAIHQNEKLNDDAYNVISTFSKGLLKGFREIDVSAFSTTECIEKNINFNMAIGFNTTGIDYWQKILSNNVTNIIWSVDSVFAQNFKAVQMFSAYEKFIAFESTPADLQAVNTYIPNLKHGYIPLAADLDFWKNQPAKKENDIVYFSSMIDYEEKLQQLKETMPELVYKLMMQIYEISSKNPNLTFWQIAEIIKKTCDLNLDVDQYILLFENISTIIKYEQKAKMIQALSDFDVKVYGNGPWEKYIKGKVQYLGPCDVKDSVDIMNKSKISLHCHPMRLGLGLHERILNASAAGTFSLVSDSPSIKAEFPDGFGYFNHSTFENIAQKADYYLTHEDEREEIAQKAYEITKNKHTWACRAKSIMDIVT